MPRLVHHVDGCRQSKILTSGKVLMLGQPGVERWNNHGVLVKVVGPKPYCIGDWSMITCRNCLAKAQPDGDRS